jgi:hypothetical protein
MGSHLWTLRLRPHTLGSTRLSHCNTRQARQSAIVGPTRRDRLLLRSRHETLPLSPRPCRSNKVHSHHRHHHVVSKRVTNALQHSMAAYLEANLRFRQQRHVHCRTATTHRSQNRSTSARTCSRCAHRFPTIPSRPAATRSEGARHAAGTEGAQGHSKNATDHCATR